MKSHGCWASFAAPTFWKQAILPRLGVLPQEPAIAKVVVALNKLDAIPPPQTQLIGAARNKLIYSSSSQQWALIMHNEGKRTHYDEGIAGPAALGMRALCHDYRGSDEVKVEERAYIQAPPIIGGSSHCRGSRAQTDVLSRAPKLKAASEDTAA
jgi:hypothetical protein